MHLIQLFLPLYDNTGTRFPKQLYLEVRNELVERFGGLTAYTQAPARGLWQESEEKVARDDLVTYEVMSGNLDTVWWKQYRVTLESRFRQDRLVIRTYPIRLL